MILVKDLISTFRPNEGDGIITYIFSSEEDKLCSSENYDFISKIFGDKEVVSWKVEQRGSIDNWLFITCKEARPHVDYRLLSREEYEEKIQAWKEKRKEEREEAKRKDQEFLESLNDIPEPSKYDNHDIRNLPVMKSVTNPLRKAGIMSIGELCQKTAKELLDIPRISKGRVKEIEEALNAYGLKLKG